jgi:transposase
MADRQEPSDALVMKVTGPGEKITKFREEMQHLQALEARRQAALGGLLSLTNPVFRLAGTRQRG